jgi:hypothetical protein
MGTRVLNNDFFTFWLGKETNRILNNIDNRFDSLRTEMRWGFGMIASLFFNIYFK